MVAGETAAFMAVGQTLNLRVSRDLADVDWESLRELTAAEGVPRGDEWIDYFVFRRGQLGPLPPFAVGRPGWDNWMIWRARKLRLPLVDMSHSVVVAHQDHGYAHVRGCQGTEWDGPEGDANRGLTRVGQALTLECATHRLEHGLVVRQRATVLERVKTELSCTPLPRRLLRRLDRGE